MCEICASRLGRCSSKRAHMDPEELEDEELEQIRLAMITLS